MKELSIEEKARRYDEALKVLHKYDGANIIILEPYQMTSNKEGKTQCLTLYHLDATKEYYNTAIEAVYNTLVKLYSE